VATGANETAPAFSPDGRWIAYASDEAGGSEIYVAAVSDPARRVKVSSGGGAEPLWRRDGLELFYRSGNQVVAATIAPNLRVEGRRPLFQGTFVAGAGGRAAYDVSPDGARLLMIRSVEGDSPGRELRVILNWQPARARQ